MAAEPDTRVPVTVLTGYLGSGKTTLLNQILTANHGKKIAVIENEFGEVGIDDALLKDRFETTEDIFEMNNGCICCTVRGDLIRILSKLFRRGTKLDGIIIETTGLADPGPVAQTFFMDESIKEFARLDGIVTLVDAKHIEQHLDEEKPEGAENESVEQIAFADRILLNKIDLVPDESALARVEARIRAINKYAPIMRCQNATVGMENVINLKAFELQRVLEMDPEFLSPDATHEHDDTVYSVGFEQEGDLNMERTNTWIAKLLQEKGVDIYRMKGVLAMAGCAERYVYQGVHMLFTGETLTPWGDAKRVNRLIFIGKNLDREGLKKGFESCLEEAGK
jgi:G3E family GTPase